jgi:hypothetical protein
LRPSFETPTFGRLLRMRFCVRCTSALHFDQG